MEIEPSHGWSQMGGVSGLRDIGTSKGGGNNPTFEHQMLNRDVVRFMLHSHPDVALPYELTFKGKVIFMI